MRRCDFQTSIQGGLYGGGTTLLTGGGGYTSLCVETTTLYFLLRVSIKKPG